MAKAKPKTKRKRATKATTPRAKRLARALARAHNPIGAFISDTLDQIGAERGDPPARDPVTGNGTNREPTLGDLIRERCIQALAGCPAGLDPIDFLDAPDFEDWTSGLNGERIMRVACALGWLRGAHEALNVTLREMLDEHEIEISEAGIVS